MSDTISNQEIEDTIKKRELDAPRVTPEMVDNTVAAWEFHVFAGSCLTVCCMTLKNGFTVTGESACASPENYDRDLGEQIAYKKAKEKIWMLEGYLLKQALYDCA